MDTTTVNIRRIADDTALFRQYDGQHGPQNVYLHLDIENGELYCAYTPHIGGGAIPEIHNRRVLTVGIPCLTADAANQLMDEAAPTAQRILDGASIEWDGNNSVGVLTADADAAYEALEAIAETWRDEPGVPLVSTLDAADWYSEGDDPCDAWGLTADTTDAELDAIEIRADEEITTAAEGVVVVTGLAAYLTGRRDEKREQASDELENVAEQYATLRAARDNLIRRLAAWNDSSYSGRVIADIAGLSHTAVQNIVKAGG